MGPLLGSLCIWWLASLAGLRTAATDPYSACPSSCTCNSIGPPAEPTEAGIRVDCRFETSQLVDRRSAHQLMDNISLPDSVLQLDLSNNKIEVVEEASFVALPMLQELNLGGNKISRLSEGAFNELPALHALDLSRNELKCDCNLKWIVRWARKMGLTFAPTNTCSQPAKLQGRTIKSLKRKELHCNWPVQTPVFEMKPDMNQIVFQGDQLSLFCNLYFVDSSATITWFYNSHELLPNSNLSSYVAVDTKESPDGTTVTSSVSLNPLSVNHSGTWHCSAQMKQGIKNHKVDITVISDETVYCPQSVTTNNKGRFIWPRTVANVSVELSCEGQFSTTSGYQPSHAYYFCNQKGFWENLLTNQCAYISEVTKVLEQFSKASRTNLSLSSKAGIGESVRRLRNYTGDGKIFQDKMDVVFISRTVEKYLEYIPQQKEIGEILIDVVSTVMRVSQVLLKDAQIEDKACSRLIQAVEKIPELVLEGDLNRYRDNIAIQEFMVKPKSFSGLTCTSYIRLSSATDFPYNEKVFECNHVDVTSKIPQHQVVEASIQLPSSLFHDLNKRQAEEFGNKQKLQFAIYRNSKLFPLTSESIQRSNAVITTSVISSQLVKHRLTNMSDPVTVQLRVQVLTDNIIPVWWDFEANDNFGDWSSEGCNVPYHSRYDEHLIIFQCNRLANFGILQDITEINVLSMRRQGAKFKFSHPMVYFGSAICLACLIVVIFVYLFFTRAIKMPKKAKHSLVNTWLAISLLCFMFSVGIYQTENVRVCQAVGIILHYLSLCVLFWMLITVNNMYKKLNKRESERELQLSDEPPMPQKPMLRFYLVGWGVAIIICGISSAVNMDEYAGYAYCFLAFGPSLAAFYGPVGILVFLICIFFCLIHCIVTNSEARRQNITDTPAGELMTAVDQPSVDAHSTSSSENDFENPPIIQLRAHAVILLLFLLMWAAAAIATAHPFQIMYDEIIFSCIYGVVSAGLGSFILVFFCLSRRDVRNCWKRLSGCRRWRNVCDTRVPQLTTSNGHVRQSTNSLASNLTNKSSHTSRSIESGVSKSNAAAPNLKGSNTVLYPEPLSSTSLNVVPEIFYNARQNGIAKRFFEKNRQHQLKVSHRHSKAKTDGDYSSGDYNTVPREYDRKHRRDRKNCTSLLDSKISFERDDQLTTLSQPLPAATDDKKLLVKSEEMIDNGFLRSSVLSETNDNVDVETTNGCENEFSAGEVDCKSVENDQGGESEPQFVYINPSLDYQLKRSTSANLKTTTNGINDAWALRQLDVKLKKETSV
uniref:G-protein coupled receptors family 2 profile 2 domain-containing protein n=1 Tax=Strigamia maritima TaxID=126957 RepID=T1IIR4_STRMM